MIRESLVPSEDAAGTTVFSASAFLGAFVFFTAGTSAFAEAVAAFLFGAIAVLAIGRAETGLSCNRNDSGWTLLAQDSSIISIHHRTRRLRGGLSQKGAI